MYVCTYTHTHTFTLRGMPPVNILMEKGAALTVWSGWSGSAKMGKKGNKMDMQANKKNLLKRERKKKKNSLSIYLIIFTSALAKYNLSTLWDKILSWPCWDSIYQSCQLTSPKKQLKLLIHSLQQNSPKGIRFFCWSVLGFMVPRSWKDTADRGRGCVCDGRGLWVWDL